MERLVAELLASLTPVEGTAALVRRLAVTGCRLVGISDNVRKIAVHLEAASDFRPRLEAAVISAEIGLLKPDPRSLRRLLADHGLVAGETVFLDDLAGDLRGADGVGMQARRFTDARQAEHDLRALGVTFDQATA